MRDSDSHNFSYQINVPNSFTASFVAPEAKVQIQGGNTLTQTQSIVPIANNRSLAGQVFADTASGVLYANANQDNGERGIPNLKLSLYLDLNENGLLDDTEPQLRSQNTDVNGNFQFTHLPAAEFVLELDTDSSLLPQSWLLHDASSQQAVSLSATSQSGLSIGLSPMIMHEHQLETAGPVYEGQRLQFEVSLEHMFAQSAISLSGARWTEFYNPSQLEFISANPAPSIVDEANGQLTWLNTGALLASEELSVQLTFRPKSTTYTQDYVVQLVSTIEALKLSDQREFRLLTDTLNQTIKASGSISGYVWNDFSGNVAGWAGSTGYEGTDGFFPQVKLLAFVCESSSGERLTPSNAAKTNQVCTSSANGGSWVLLDSVYTATDGSYHFLGLGDGYFYLSLDESSLPTNSVAKADPDESGICNNCDASWGSENDKLQDLPVVNVSTDHQNINFAYEAAAGLSGQIWHDYNGDGIQDRLEPGIANYPLELLSATCTAGLDCPIVNSDATGRYQFEGLTDGQAYTLRLGTHPQANLYRFEPTAEADNSLDGSISQTISDKQWEHGLDFGFQIQGEASLTVNVLIDWNANLQQETADEGISNVPVSLYFDANEDGVFDASTDPLVATAQTNAQGQFVFNDLIEGSYFHQLQAQDHSVLGQSQLIGDPDENAGCQSCDAIAKTSFVSSTGSASATWYFQPLGDYEISGIVWQDINSDAAPQTGMEAALENISVSLAVDLNQDGTFVLLETQSSDVEGAFRFAELIDASYQLTVDNQDTDLPQNASGSLYQPSNPVQTLATLEDGELTFSTQTETELYFGFSPLASVGDMVFWDFDGDGQLDPLEQGIAGVEVCLCEGEVSSCTSANALMSTTTSDGTDGNAIGSYQFADLVPGDYTIEIGTTTSPISNAALTASPASLGASCVGDCVSNYHFQIENGRELKGINFGYEAKGVMGGVVWYDINNNKVMDEGEKGLANQTIALVPPSRIDIGGGRGRAVIKTTNQNGEYNFYDLPDGYYRLSPKAPVGYVLTNDGDGDINGLAYIYIRSGKVLAIGRSYCTDCDMDANVGLREGGNYSISGKICIDDPTLDGSCNNASLDRGLEGFKVLLSKNDGTYLGMVDTDAAGNYSFSNLNSGTYHVSLSQTRFPLSLSSLSTDLAQSPATQITSDSAQSTLQVVLGSTNLSGVDFAYDLAIDFDLGNLPIAYYQRTGFAYHILHDQNVHYLGQQVLSDEVSLSTTNGYIADLSIANNVDDGVNFLELSSWQDGTVAAGKGGSLQAEASAAGWLVGWIDFNQDQDFLDEGEMIISQAASAGSNVYTFDIPAGTSLDQTYYSRIRLFEAEPIMPLIAFSGGALGGEIEDYSVDFSSLPVQLLSFTAEQGGQSVELNWTTASEENTYGFDIERSIDGLLFNSIGQVAAIGNSVDLQTYDWQDQSIANLDFPKLYYRLKMVDLDGSFTYSQIESVKLSSASDFSLMLAPSPPLDFLNVEFTADPARAAELVIVNSLGQVMWTESLIPEPGVNHWKHPVAEYLNGVYFLRLLSGQEKRVIKFIIN
ncbi:MAG: SdrD B-like domain-containing protein [Bacteroidota bacterium]